MSDFTVSEEKGDKLYKLIIVIFSSEGMKIISKETVDGQIHFCIYFGKVDPDTKEFLSSVPKYRSPDKGVTKEGFESFVSEKLAKMPDNAEIIVNDLTEYQTLKEQYKAGLNKGIMKVKGSNHG